MEDGLPNIIGSATVASIGGAINGTYAFVDSATSYGQSWGSASGQNVAKLNFDASKSNAIYGASDKVQPSSLTLRYYIKF